MEKKALGRGLQALLSDTYSNEKPAVLEVEIDKIKSNPDQPRKRFDQEAILELSQSIKSKGIIQPLIIKEIALDKYFLIAGERRLRAAKMAGLEMVPVVIKNYSESEILEVSLIENIQRRDLDPIEEAESLAKLIKDFNYSHEKLGQKLGKSRSNISNSLRLLKLPNRIKELTIEGKISAGHARALVVIDDEFKQNQLLEDIITNHLSVRQVEELVPEYQNLKNNPESVIAKKEVINQTSPDWVNMGQLQSDIKDAINAITTIKLFSDNKGQIEIKFNSIEEFNSIYNKIIK